MEAKEAEYSKCSICEGPIEHERGWTKGHNAEPINSGRCCSTCNFTVVMERRLRDAGIGSREASKSVRISREAYEDTNDLMDQISERLQERSTDSSSETESASR